TSWRKNKKAPTNKIEVAINNVDVQHDEERDPMMDVPDDLPTVVMTTDDKLHDTVDNLPLVDGPPERLLSGDDLQLLEEAVSDPDVPEKYGYRLGRIKMDTLY
ncbi:hypothetical protein HDU67_005984, partial [Dinochytrium kinnereticum]